MNLRAVILSGAICAIASCETIDGFVLSKKPWWLKIVTKDWQWVTIEPKIYYPPDVDPLKYPAIIEHEKVHVSQQRKIGKYYWIFKYVISKNFRLEQEMEPIITELSNTPFDARKALAARYARSLSGPPYYRAAKSYDLALECILAKAKEMSVEY
jgi:hypothetical protein